MSKRTCTHCDEEWEDSFFCDKCSKPEFDEVLDGTGSLVSGWFPQDVCLNCCSCSVAGISASKPAYNKSLNAELPTAAQINVDVPF